MNKKLYGTAITLWSILAIAFTLLFTACSDDDTPSARSRSKLVQITQSSFISPDDFSTHVHAAPTLYNQYLQTLRPVLDPLFQQITIQHRLMMDLLFYVEVGKRADGQRNWQIEYHTFTYHTVSSRGEDILLTGRVVFPNNMDDETAHEVQSLTLFSHGANKMMNIPSTSEERIDRMDMRTFLNSAIISPDFQGMGHHIGTDAYCFISSKVLARQLADCALAALEVMKSRNVTLAPEGYTLNVGKSQGAVIPVAFAKYYETEAPQWFREQLKLKTTLAYSGPLDFTSFIQYLSDHPDFNAMLSKGMVASLSALSEKRLDGYHPEEFMSDIFHNTIVEMDGKQMTYYEALSKYQYNVIGTEKDVPATTHLSDILAADMLTSDGKLNAESPKTQTMLRLFAEENYIFNWKPTLPIYILHSPSDDVIPYGPSHRYYETLSEYGTNHQVEWADMSIPPVSSAILSQIPMATHIVPIIYMDYLAITNESVEDMLDKLTH